MSSRATRPKRPWKIFIAEDKFKLLELEQYREFYPLETVGALGSISKQAPGDEDVHRIHAQFLAV